MFSKAIVPWHLLPLAFFLGMANALDAPARHSFIVQVVEKKEDLGNAIALNSAMFNGARLVGPPVAGILIALTGEGICFLLNGVQLPGGHLRPAGHEIRKQKKGSRQIAILDAAA